MATAAYTGWLTDLGDAPFPDAIPRLTVTAADVYGPRGLVAGAMREVVVPINSDGSFSVELIPSTDLVPSVPYKLRCSWFTTDVGGQEVLAGWAEWDFTALPGGGPIVEMIGAPVSVWFFGPPWPSVPRPGYYYDLTTDNIGEWGN